VTGAIPETVEASFQLSQASLVMLGVAMGPAIAAIHEKRDALRRELLSAAAAARDSGGESPPRSVLEAGIP
jgi:CPA2 family monovalent cation:H+ antiporter-2